MKTSKVTDEQLLTFISEHQTWSLKDSKLHREFVFSNFITAFGFMTQVALTAEHANHHPEWFNVYKTVVVDLTTHEAKGISIKDFELAKEMNKIADRLM
ncbi:MAG: 4a-hydroxytetrahydrobiopterin dehydratase [Gammaproteobacteria bacterium]|nr:4a-hydroxytetrahydrobiopterin dehydratase [Gammaproteobacteria bacterium]